MATTFKALSALLSYPTADIKAAAPAIRAALAGEAIAPKWLVDRLERLIGEIETQDLLELQERYVFLFDRTRSLSLHLFEHVHGESRDRGQAMVDLRTLYEQAGLDADARELPDYLPMFLEYLSLRPVEEARALLAEPIAVFAALRERLARRKSPYAYVLRTIEAIAAGEPAARHLDELLKAPDDDPNDFAALDAGWEDQPVTFGPGSSSGDAPCNSGDARR
ncbi:MAG: nitrate reductase molybdenum cofactor assembly chaperone [Parvularculaceae bacterium]|nr:nitrate reductase molybdenum cofactor assembly chaperone [Parvularculaceae bacterium]